jgi:hypothetical protein
VREGLKDPVVVDAGGGGVGRGLKTVLCGRWGRGEGY